MPVPCASRGAGKACPLFRPDQNGTSGNREDNSGEHWGRGEPWGTHGVSPKPKAAAANPLQAPGAPSGGFFPQISPCFMSCQKPRSFYEISHSFQHPQLTFQN